VNHNVGELQLFGESGDDTFFLKAQLQDRDDGTGKIEAKEIDGGLITAGAGDDKNNIDESDTDILIDYVENNRVEIFGGSGFDTVVVAGTALDDEFYVFTDKENSRQYLFGAGLKLENIEGIERLALVTGAGDDTVYLYGLKENLSLLLSLGSGNDRLIIGGDEKTFDVTYPAASAVYTVEQDILADMFLSEALTYNDVLFVKRSDNPKDENYYSLTDKQAAWRQFYYRWIESETFMAEVPDTLSGVSANVTIDPKHWNLLEANLTVALKLYAQAIEKAVRAPVHGTYLWNMPDAWTWPEWVEAWNERAQYIDDINAFEQGLLEVPDQNWNSMTWSWQDWFWWFGHYTSNANQALDNGTHPQLPDVVDFENLTGIVPDSDLRAGIWPLERVFYEVYMRQVVAFTMVGWFARADQVRTGTDLYSPRIQGWGYEPDLYGYDVYWSPTLTSTGWLAPIAGAENPWTPNEFLSLPLSLNVGASMFWDLISLFYEVQAPQNHDINVEHAYEARYETGSASYRFDDLPERVVEKILPANYDLTRIAGVVRLAGGPGDDIIEINARDDSGTEVTVSKQVLNLADYTFSNSNDHLTGMVEGITHDDVQGALIRADKETRIGILDELANGTIASADIQVSLDETVETFTLQEALAPLNAAAQDLRAALADPSYPATASQIAYRDKLEGFVLRGRQLLGEPVVSTAKFSMDALDQLLNNNVLLGMIDANTSVRDEAAAVKAALLELQDYLTYVSVSRGLSEDYTWSPDTGLRVYRQITPELSDRQTTYRYTQEIWVETTLNQAEVYNAGTGVYTGRLDPYRSEVEPLADNDLDNARGTRRLIEIVYTVAGDTYTVGGTGTALAGNTVEMEKEYVRQLDNLDTSYYTYSYYGVGSQGNKMLESVAIRRLNDTDPKVDAVVAGKSALDAGVYLTAANWPAYLDALRSEGYLTGEQEGEFEIKKFTDASVQELIETAFGQTLRTDLNAPIMDGLLITDNSDNVDSVDIKALQDDAGFFLPQIVTILRTIDKTITVSSDYVVAKTAGTEYTLTYDRVLGLNPQGFWFSGFETAGLTLNALNSMPVTDRVSIESTHFLADITISTGAELDGDDILYLTGTHTGTTTVHTGDGNDSVNISTWSGDLRIDGQEGNDAVTLNLTGDRSAAITVEDTGTSGNDRLTVNGTAAADEVDLTRTRLTLTAAASLETIDYTDMEQLVVNTGEGADDVTVESTQTSSTGFNLGEDDDTLRLKSLDANVVAWIYGGPGDDTVNVGNDNDLLADISGIAAFFGDAGTDTLNVYGDGSGGNTGQLTAIGVTGLGMGTNMLVSTHNDVFGAGYDFFDPSYPAAIYYGTRTTENGTDLFSSTVENVHVYLGAGDDRFNVDSTYAYGSSYVHGGLGDDTITVGSTPTGLYPSSLRRVDFVAGPLLVDGEDGPDTIIVEDSGDDNANTGTYEGATVTGLDMSGSVTFASADHIEIRLGAQADTFYVAATTEGLTTTLNTGGGFDKVYLGTHEGSEYSGSLDGFQGSLIIEAEGPETGDTIYFNDMDNTADQTYVFSNEVTDKRKLLNKEDWPIDTTTVSRTGTANILYRPKP
jgi:hypothetical protein